MSSQALARSAEPPSAWSPLRRPVFRTLWIAALVANTGIWLQNVGAAWLMATLTTSPAMVALVQAATTLPMVLLALLAGALADVVDGRRLLLATHAWMLAVVAGLGALTLFGATTPWPLLTLTLLFGVGTAMSTPAWQAVTLQLVPRAELPVAIALAAASINIARAIGPTVGGVLVSVAGPGLTFVLNALVFLVVLAPLYRWRRPPSASSLPPEHVVEATQAGFRYVRYAPELRGVLVRTAAFLIFGSAPWALLPLVSRGDLGLGPSGYGALLGCLGAGAVGGAVLLPRARGRASAETLVAAATVGFAAVTLALAYVRFIPALGAALVVGGVAWLTLLSCFISAGQAIVPAWVRARVVAVQLLALFGGMTIGSILWGALAELVGIGSTLAVAALGMVASLATALRFPLPSGEDLDLTPAGHWAEPHLVTQPDPERGPVLVTVEYRIDPARADDFARAMRNVRLERLRDGAMGWNLYSDPEQPSRWLEAITISSWAEHVRAHGRVTVADRASEQCARHFHVGEGPPSVTHLVTEPLDR